ncbi:MAG: TIGR04283 family arsenosugar biosynthesis glycosyltransferase [Thermodesulfovibrionales bacterium]
MSVIVPALNEEKALGKTLGSLELTENEELIVVDGGSSDATVAVASRYAHMVLSAQRGRARQMNAGAARARGDILFFLHADCVPPAGAFGMIRETVARKGVSAGAFDLAIAHPGLCFRLIELGANLRSRLTSIAYGDQGLFMRRSVFEEIGGFADIPLMEDIEISSRLKKAGEVVFLRPPVSTEPRRWLTEGALYTTLRDWSLALSYSVFGASPERLARHYRDVR